MRGRIHLILLALLAAGGHSVYGDSAVGQSPEGTWMVSVTFTTPTTVFPSSFLGFDSYMAGGVYIGTSNVGTQPYHGQWERVGDRQFVQTFRFFVFDSKGAYAAYIKVRALHQLEDSLDHMHGVLTAELYTPDGKLLNSANGAVQSQRMELEVPDVTLDSADRLTERR